MTLIALGIRHCPMFFEGKEGKLGYSALAYYQCQRAGGGGKTTSWENVVHLYIVCQCRKRDLLRAGNVIRTIQSTWGFFSLTLKKYSTPTPPTAAVRIESAIHKRRLKYVIYCVAEARLTLGDKWSCFRTTESPTCRPEKGVYRGSLTPSYWVGVKCWWRVSFD